MDYQPTSQQQQQQQQPSELHHSSCALLSNEQIALLKQQQHLKLQELLKAQEQELEQLQQQLQIAKRRQQQQQLQQQALEEQRKRRQDPFAPVRMTPSRTFDLYAGSKFRGIQRSGDHSYDVRVDIKNVDLNESFLCGYLHIDGLTEEYPQLTTYFEAEIIGPKHSFHTRKWDADELIDEEHWTQFEPFECLANSVFYGADDDDDNEDDDEEDGRCPHHLNYDPHTYNHKNEDVVFMRWKEHFLVPDHRVQGISGASFAGFYYICYNKKTGSISGYYYHHTSEKFQQLLLSHVEDRTSSSFEFR
ncbi:GID complex subunit 4, VID24 [Mortierella sp. AD094]|nr:GID complex subunit 4, VID24 [Mortierella sp. AD094]